jgi:hypothetical protein
LLQLRGEGPGRRDKLPGHREARNAPAAEFSIA